MVEIGLKQELIRAGESLVRRLDAAGMGPEAAFWLYSSDVENWKLVFANPKVVTNGPKENYRVIQKLLRKSAADTPELSLEQIALVKPDATIVSLLRTAVKTGPGIAHVRFTGNVINGIRVDDAYIYRL